jgi:hypothetical protein
MARQAFIKPRAGASNTATIGRDAMLAATGWTVQDDKAFDLTAHTGIALREVSLKSGRCDYLLLVNRKPIGVIEAKKVGMIPHLTKQIRFVAEVKRRLSVVEGLEAFVTTNLQRATRLRQAVLQKAFSGLL